MIVVGVVDVAELMDVVMEVVDVVEDEDVMHVVVDMVVVEVEASVTVVDVGMSSSCAECSTSIQLPCVGIVVVVVIGKWMPIDGLRFWPHEETDAVVGSQDEIDTMLTLCSGVETIQSIRYVSCRSCAVSSAAQTITYAPCGCCVVSCCDEAQTIIYVSCRRAK